MQHWFHNLLGKYDIEQQYIGLDYSKHFLDPLGMQLTLTHESTHRVLALSSDSGLALDSFVKLKKAFMHISQDEVEKQIKAFMENQIFVQEGLATFMQFQRYRSLRSKTEALRWIEDLPDDYRSRVKKLMFVSAWPQKRIDMFTRKIPYLAMESNIRIDAPKCGLFKSSQSLIEYFHDDNSSPNKRLEKLVECLRHKPWLITKELPEIASESCIEYHEPATKIQVVKYMNYILGLAGRPQDFSTKFVSDAKENISELVNSESIVVSNLNLNLAESAEYIVDINDFIHYSDVIKIIFVNLPSEEYEHRELLESITGVKPQINLLGLTSTGEKYLIATSFKRAEKLLSDSFTNTTLVCKWGGYNPITNSFIWSSTCRPPDIALYNGTAEMINTVEKLLANSPVVKFQHIHIAASDDNPLQSVVFKTTDKSPLHITNTYGNASILKLTNTLSDRSSVFSNADLRHNKDTLNNYMGLMGMPWDIDWIETMLDGEKLHSK